MFFPAEDFKGRVVGLSICGSLQPTPALCSLIPCKEPGGHSQPTGGHSILPGAWQLAAAPGRLRMLATMFALSPLPVSPAGPIYSWALLPPLGA